MANHEIGYLCSVLLRVEQEEPSVFLDLSFCKYTGSFQQKIAAVAKPPDSFDSPYDLKLRDLAALVGPMGLTMFSRVAESDSTTSHITSEGWTKVYYRYEMNGNLCLWNPNYGADKGPILAVAQGGEVHLLKFNKKDSLPDTLHFDSELIYDFKGSLHKSQDPPPNPAITAISWSYDGDRLLVWERGVKRVHTAYFVKRRGQKITWAHDNLPLDDLLPNDGPFQSFFGCCSPTDSLFVTTADTSTELALYRTTKDSEYSFAKNQWTRLRRTMTGGGVISMRFSPDGLLLAALSNTVRTWTVQGKYEDARLVVHRSLEIENPLHITLGCFNREIYLVTCGETLQTMTAFVLQGDIVKNHTPLNWAPINIETKNMGTADFNAVYHLAFHKIRKDHLCILGSFGFMQVWGIDRTAFQRVFSE